MGPEVSFVPGTIETFLVLHHGACRTMAGNSKMERRVRELLERMTSAHSNKRK